MVILEDGKGTGNKASINVINRLDVSSRAADRAFYPE